MLREIHFLLTYTCLYECDHCFLYCGPEAEGTFTLKQLRAVFAEMPRIGTIEKEIQKSDLGLTPVSDGTFIRLAIPMLTEERRKELVKLVRKYAEEARIAVRNIRRDANDQLKREQKEGNLSEDELKRLQDENQKLTDQHIEVIDNLLGKKEEEIMEV